MSTSAPERLVVAQLAPQPWKNGAGLTRELAVEPPGAGFDSFGWRISIAEVERDAPFSAFVGIDRCITLLRGAGMHLASADGAIDHRLDRALVPFEFAGDIALDATLVDGPCSDFNVMTRRGVWRADVTLHRQGFIEADGSDALLLLGQAGTWLVEAGATDHDASWPLIPGQALLWRAAPRFELWTTPLQPAAALLAVRLCHDRIR